MAFLAWSPVKVAENPILSMNLAPALTVAADTVVSATAEVTVMTGFDPTPAGLLAGPCAFSGAVVSFQKSLGQGVAGTTYLILVTATTALGQVIVDGGRLYIYGGECA